MSINLIDAQNPEWANSEKTRIEVQAKWQHLESEGYLQFSADPNDTEAHGVDLYDRCVAEEFGTVADYTPLPTVTSISPSTLNSAGGQTVVITGTNFIVGETTVHLAGTAPSSTTVNSATQITITGTPAKTAGTYTNGLLITRKNWAKCNFSFTTED
jgi:hypothetical protein